MPNLKRAAGQELKKPQPKYYDPVLGRGETSDDDTIMCSKCGCVWLEKIQVHQYPKVHNIVLGQQPPTKTDLCFWLFKCVKCGELYEPSVQIASASPARKKYDAFLDHMEKPIKKPDPQGEPL